jgi:hypothetical protein
MSYNPNPGGSAYPPGGSYNAGGPTPMVSQASVQDVINSWIAALTRPSVQTFSNELARFSQNRLFMSVGLATLVAAVFGLLGGIFSGNLVGGFIGALIATPIAFFLGQGVVWLIARLFGGTGDYMQQAWVNSTFWAPLLIISQLSFIPIIGGLIALAGWVYSLYLMYLALQPVQRLDSQRSLFVVLTLLAIGVVLAICAFALGAAALLGLAAASNTTP